MALHKVGLPTTKPQKKKHVYNYRGRVPILFNHRYFQKPAAFPTVFVFFLERRIPEKNGEATGKIIIYIYIYIYILLPG